MQPCPLKIQMFKITLLIICAVRYGNDKNKLYRSSFGDHGKLLSRYTHGGHGDLLWSFDYGSRIYLCYRDLLYKETGLSRVVLMTPRTAPFHSILLNDL